MNQRRKNFLEHIIRPLQDFVIPKPNHAKSTARQILRPLDVVEQIVCVLSSVDFDDQSRTNAHEIDDISTDRLLSAKPMISKMPIAQVSP